MAEITNRRRGELVPSSWGRGVSRPAEDRVGADAPPDDVLLARLHLVAVLESGPTVGRPSHLPDAPMTLHPLDA